MTAQLSDLNPLEHVVFLPALAKDEELDAPDQIVETYLKEYWDFADHISVELRGVSFTELLPLHGSRMTSTVREYMAHTS